MKFIKNIYGLNFAEIMLSVCIMTIAIMTIAGMFISGMLGMKKGDNVIVATNLAQSAMEQAKNVTATDFATYGTGTEDLLFGDPPKTEVTIGGTIYKGKMYTNNIEYTLDPNTKTKIKYIQISIYSDNKSVEGKSQNKDSEITFSTYVKNIW